MPEMIVRPAEAKDARGIVEAHYSAVHDCASKDYPAEVIAEWSPVVTGDRISECLTELSSGRTTLVADLAGDIVGYGVVVESKNALRDLYVAKYSGGQGVGSALLSALESISRERGCTELTLNATLNAERFYLRRGYEEIERGVYTLSSGRGIAYVRMRKSL